MKEEKPHVDFALQGIKTEQFAIFEDNYMSKKESSLGTELKLKLDQKSKQLGVFIGFEFTQGKKVFLKIEVSCHFKIAEKSWNYFIQKQDDSLIIPKDFLAHLVMMTIGTTRGVLFTKTESTVFSTFIVPAINVTDMIKEDASFDIISDSE
ncbi:hypothetical protein ERX46_10215 [Brumimicrobium glaciale]|uniref:Preprotein translocase subunit SecB n=1 Tax=Brumimicrobium glaciale TaxID=200475 RepID=A0A4Q4KN18_9FLAO|nr:hypothetical protein [Brumimicrobium glaciale]RYM33309.1 hypothetical protein ERX46_10215 [Brumimicrobium glaciale]